MRINFRQGIVSHQVSGSSQDFLKKNTSGHIDLQANNKPVTVTIAHRDKNYIHSEGNSVANAWTGPFLNTQNYWLYWDFNQLTFQRTFGYTTLEPVAQSVPPGAGNVDVQDVIAGGPGVGSFVVNDHYILPVGRVFQVVGSTGNDGTYTVDHSTFNEFTGQTTITVTTTVPDGTADGELTLDIDSYGEALRQVGRHWYDTTNNIHYVWQGTMWTPVLRVFAAQLANGNTFIPQTIAHNSFIGTQIGNTASVRAGRVLYDEASDPIRRDNGTFFTTEDQFFANATRVDAIRLESNVARAQFPFESTTSAFTVVAWTEDGKAQRAEYNDAGTTVVGMLTEDVAINGVGGVIIQGVVTNPDWNWTGGVDAVPVGTPLWIDVGINAGKLTPYDPHVYNATSYPIGRVPVARVLDSNTVVFEQGLGGKGDPGPPGSIEDIPEATYTEVGGVRLKQPDGYTGPVDAIVVMDIDPRLSDERDPLPHEHQATEVTYSAAGGVTATNVQDAIHQLGDGKLNKSGGTMTGFLTLNADPTADLHAATKHYVDGLVSGLSWKDPIQYVNLISDALSAPPGSPEYSDIYVVAAGGSGAWAGKDGHVMQWDEDTTSWIDRGLLSSYPAGTRFGVAMETPTSTGGTFAGLETQIATLEDPSGPVWSFYIPSQNDAVYVNNPDSLHAYHQYVFDGTIWIEFGGNFEALTPDNTTIIQTGNVLSVKPASSGGTVDAATLEGYNIAGLDLRYAALSHGHNASEIAINPSPIITGDWGTPVEYDWTIISSANVQLAIAELHADKAMATPRYATAGDFENYALVQGMYAYAVDTDSTYYAGATGWVELASNDGTVQDHAHNIPYDISYFMAGVPLPNEVVGSFVATRNISIPLNAPGSIAIAEVAPSGPNVVLQIHLNGVQVGTVTFATGSTSGVIALGAGSPGGVELVAGDKLQIKTGGAAADPALRDITMTLVGCALASSCTP